MPRRPHARLLRHLAVGLVALWSLTPIAVIVVSSFKLPRDIFVWPPTILFQPTLASYAGLWRRWPGFFDNLTNSAVVTIGTTLLAVAVATLAGYVYSRYRSRLLTVSAFFMIFVRMLPPIVISLPLFPAVNAIGLSDTRTVLILLYAAFFVSLGTWIMKTTIDQIPRELDEAARVDGATSRQIVWRVILPLSVQGMIAAGVFVAVYAWNEFLFAFLFTTINAKTAPLAVSEMIGSVETSDWGVLFAAATIQLVPVLAGVILAQRYLIAGLTAGSLKG
ncbi:MAG: carbohydrate ABC transporter permease [Hyphomicrobiales bacterium]